MAKANFLQPAKASLVDEWAGFIREEFPEKAKEVDIAAFADGPHQGLLGDCGGIPQHGRREADRLRRFGTGYLH